MPPRTGPRRRKRIKQTPPAPQRRFALIRADDTAGLLGPPEVVHSHRIALSDGHLMLHDEDDAIIRIIAKGQWREIRPAVIGDIPYADEAGDNDRIDSMQREEATLTEVTRGTPPPVPEPVPENRAVNSATEPDSPAVVSGIDRRFVPSSPEEAQRVLMEIHRRLSPDYQDPPEKDPK